MNNYQKEKVKKRKYGRQSYSYHIILIFRRIRRKSLVIKELFRTFAANLQTAKNLKNMGFSTFDIQKATGLTEEEINSL